MPDSSLPSGSRINTSPVDPHTLLNNLPGIVYRRLIDDDWTAVYLSEACPKLTGYAPSDFIENRKISWPQLIHPDDLGRVRGEVQSALKEERPFQLEYRIRTVTGKVKWLWEEGCGIYTSNGDVEAIEGYCIDITDRKRAERALIEREAQFRTLVEHAPEAIVVLDTDTGRFVDLNENAIKMFGLDRDQIEQVGPIEMSPPLQPDRRPSAEAAMGVIQEALDGKTPVFEWMHRNSAGKDFLCEVRLVRLPSEGRNLIRGSVTDITLRKQAEEALRESISLLEGTLESTGDGILVVDLAGKIVRFNQKFTSMWRIPESILESRDDQKALDWVLDQLKHPDQFMDKVQELYSQPEVESYDILEFKDERIFERYSQPQRIGDRPVGRVWGFRDVTDRNRAEWALSRSEKKNWALLDAIPDLIFQINRDGTYLDFLDFKGSKETGLLLAPDQFLGKKMQDVLPEEVSRPAIYYMQKALETGKTQTFEYQLEIEGKMNSYEARLAVCGKDEVLAIVRDISDRRLAEEERDRYFNLSLDLVCIAGFDGYCKHLNPSWEHTLGWAIEELLSKPYLEFIHPEDREATIGEAKKLSAGHPMIGFENRYRCKDGSYKWLQWKAYPDLQKALIYASARDITDQKRSETDLRVRANQQSIVAGLGQRALAGCEISDLMDETVRSVAQTLDVDLCKVLELLPDGKNLLLRAGIGWNEGLVGHATVSTGKESQAGYTLLSNDPVIVKDLREESRFKGPALLWNHGVISGASVIIPASDHAYGVLGAHTRHPRSFSQTDAHFLQSVAHVLALAVDRKRIEEEIRRLNNELEQRVLERTAELAASNKELEAFSYSVSHDLTTPLRAINGFSQALLEDYNDLLDKTGKQHLHRVRAATLRMSELIDDLLNLSRVTRSNMERIPVDLTRMAESVVAELKETQRYRAVRIVIARNLMTKGDPRLLRIMLENLLGNAWKFTGKTARARMDFGKTKHEGRPVFHIRDNGAGFDMAYAGKLFNAFQRLHGANEFPGTGIGLAIVQGIILRHGGKIWVEASPEKGATFYFSLS